VGGGDCGLLCRVLSSNQVTLDKTAMSKERARRNDRVGYVRVADEMESHEREIRNTDESGRPIVYRF